MLKKFWRCKKNMYFCGNKFTSNKEKHKSQLHLLLKRKNGKFADSGECQEPVCQF